MRKSGPTASLSPTGVLPDRKVRDSGDVGTQIQWIGTGVTVSHASTSLNFERLIVSVVSLYHVAIENL
jgi:hypothetical protein